MQPFNEIYASKIAGVVLDCVVNPYLPNAGKTASGGTPTDNTTAINNALLSLAAVGVGAMRLILDGGTATTGLTLPSVNNCEIAGIGWQSGIYVLSGSNHDAIQNGIPYTLAGFQPSGVAPAPSGYVRLSNFCINGNRGNGTTGNSNSGNPRGITGVYWYANVALYGVLGLRIEDMFIYDSPTYSMRLMNCSDVAITNNEIINPNATAGVNNDGIHIDGPFSNVSILGNHIDNNYSDDAIALNCPEGYTGGANITRVTITGNTFTNVFAALRVYGGTNALAGEVVFSSNTGNAQAYVVVLGFTSSGIADASGRSILVANNNFQSTGNFISIGDNIGDLLLNGNVWDSPNFAGQFIVGTGGTASSITVNNCQIYRSTVGNNTSTPLLAASGSLAIGRMTISDFQVINQQGQSYSAIANLLAMTNVTIGALYIAALDYTNIAALADSYSGITNLYGEFQPESNIQSKTSAYTLLPTDRTILASTTSGSFAVTLPTTAYKGQKHTIKNTGTANTLTVTGTVDGSANPTLTTLQFMTVLYDGTAWRKVG
jgi:hypothetical protein